jgi:hypothetical protein
VSKLLPWAPHFPRANGVLGDADTLVAEGEWAGSSMGRGVEPQARFSVQTVPLSYVFLPPHFLLHTLLEEVGLLAWQESTWGLAMESVSFQRLLQLSALTCL